MSWEDLRPQLAVVANTGAGADIVISFAADPHIYAAKMIELTDLADYLGQKYGGWYDLLCSTAEVEHQGLDRHSDRRRHRADRVSQVMGQ